jgi:hypothetical protein
MFALVIAALAFALAAQKWKTGLLALVSFHVHLFEDVLGPAVRMAISGLFLIWRRSLRRSTCVARTEGP